MNFHWLSDQSKLGNYYVYWDKGANNRSDYHSKHHPPSHHRTERPTYILKGYHVNAYINKYPHLTARVCLSRGTDTVCASQ